jgi:hypothetical protein
MDEVPEVAVIKIDVALQNYLNVYEVEKSLLNYSFVSLSCPH